MGELSEKGSASEKAKGNRVDPQDIPILEFDPSQRALIEPSEVFESMDVSEHCVICFFGDIVNHPQEVLDSIAIPQAVPFTTVNQAGGPGPGIGDQRIEGVPYIHHAVQLLVRCVHGQILQPRMPVFF